jgi:hypothetical protein
MKRPRTRGPPERANQAALLGSKHAKLRALEEEDDEEDEVMRRIRRRAEMEDSGGEEEEEDDDEQGEGYEEASWGGDDGDHEVDGGTSGEDPGEDEESDEEEDEDDEDDHEGHGSAAHREGTDLSSIPLAERLAMMASGSEMGRKGGAALRRRGECAPCPYSRGICHRA